MFFYLAFYGILGFSFTSLMFYFFKKNAVPNPEEIDSYMKAAALGKLSQEQLANFTVHTNKKAAS
ncbi:MAG: hypothetical protein AAGI07_19740 [Bacteroidota bacterium]